MPPANRDYMQMVELPSVRPEAATADNYSRVQMRNDDSRSTKMAIQASINETPTNLNAKYMHNQFSQANLMGSKETLHQRRSPHGKKLDNIKTDNPYDESKGTIEHLKTTNQDLSIYDEMGKSSANIHPV